MIKCDLCGKEFDSKRAMHGHLVRVHYDEYKAAGCNQETLTSGEKPLKYERSLGVHPSNKRPAGFRLLNKGNVHELTAYNEGYRYIDADRIVYDAAEVAAEGWV